jgi:hypothetical protein
MKMKRNRRQRSGDSSPRLMELNQLEVVDGANRGRCGRRAGDERTRAVLLLFSGKTTVDQLAHRLGEQAEAIDGGASWR